MLAGPGARSHPPSPFFAGVLSLVFPGLGQAYAGAWHRALAWAAPPILLIALALGVVVRGNRFELAGLAFQDWFLNGVLVGNLILLLYRAAAIVDAWWLARRIRAGVMGPPEPPGPATGTGQAMLRELGRSVPAAGLLATVLVMAIAHVAVARYDLLLNDLGNCVFDSTGAATCQSGSSDASQPADTGAAADTGEPTLLLPSEGTALPSATLPTWNGTDRLNILLVGIDQRPGQSVFNTDTLIVVSIDPTTNRVAMFSIPRDTVDVPLPPGPLRQALGSVYTAKVNSIWAELRDRPDLCPGSSATARGFNCLKEIIGYLYGLNVQYYAEVNFDGFTNIVNTLGGVTIDVQSPVVDDRYPAGGGNYQRIYIPTGIQAMDGTQALIYARSRHGSTDFDRGARQQRVLTSLLAQANIPAILSNLDTLASEVGSSVHTDIPRSILPQLLGLASKVDTTAIRSYVFAPPLYETEDYVPGVHDLIYPKVGLIRDAVAKAFTQDPSFEAEREKVAQEGATVWVLNGSGQPSLATDLAAYLDYQGFEATAPTQKAPKTTTAQIVAYNGALATYPDSIARLEAIFGVTAVAATNPAVHADIVVTVGSATQDLTPPDLP